MGKPATDNDDFLFYCWLLTDKSNTVREGSNSDDDSY